jgi:hypothetical protein
MTTHQGITQPEDGLVRANTMRQQAETMRVLITDGFDRDSVVKAVTAGDLSSLTTDDRQAARAARSR